MHWQDSHGAVQKNASSSDKTLLMQCKKASVCVVSERVNGMQRATPATP